MKNYKAYAGVAAVLVSIILTALLLQGCSEAPLPYDNPTYNKNLSGYLKGKYSNGRKPSKRSKRSRPAVDRAK